jgi:hypothetical protein
MTIELKGVAGEKSLTRYYSNSHTKTFNENQLVREKEESVDFEVEQRMLMVDNSKGILKYVNKTIRKDGAIELHDLGFPELREEIEYIVRTNGMILQAGRYSPQSIFYIPAFPIPEKEVEVGDTWTMNHVWMSARENIPLSLEMVGILKDIVPCGKGQCADIEISGGVNLGATPTAPGAFFESRIWGHMLYSAEKGDVVWSDIRSHEEMRVQQDRVVVSSCMVSETKQGGDYKMKFTCDPKAETISKPPK